MPIFFRCHKRLSICKTTALDLSVGSLFSSSMKEVFIINALYHCHLYFYPTFINTSLIVFVRSSSYVVITE